MGISPNPVLTDCQGKQNRGLFQLLHFTATFKFKYHFFIMPKVRRHEKYDSELSAIN